MAQEAEDQYWSYHKIKLMICFINLDVSIKSQYISIRLTRYKCLHSVICKVGFKYLPDLSYEAVFQISVT